MSIGKLIYGAIQADNQLVTKLGTRVYPIVAEVNTDFPFVTYSRQNVYPMNASKDGWFSDSISFNITVCSGSYEEACEIADLIRDCFENKVISNTNLEIRNIHLTQAAESWSENTYVQSLTFTCTT